MIFINLCAIRWFNESYTLFSSHFLNAFWEQQIKGQWKVNHEVLAKLHKEAKQLSSKCISFEISHVLRVHFFVHLSLSLSLCKLIIPACAWEQDYDTAFSNAKYLPLWASSFIESKLWCGWTSKFGCSSFRLDYLSFLFTEFDNIRSKWSKS